MTSSKLVTTSEPYKLDWEPLRLTEGKVEMLWEKIRQFPEVFDDFSMGNFDEFVAKFFAKWNVFVDIGPGLGLAAGFGVRPRLDMVLHLVMFDRRLRGREATFWDIMSYFFRALQLKRMTAMLGEDARTGIKLAERLGFKREGTLRKALLQGGILRDVHIFGILREELENVQAKAFTTGPASANAPQPESVGVLEVGNTGESQGV